MSKPKAISVSGLMGNPLLAGENPEPGLVAAEHVPSRDGTADEMVLFVREGDRTVETRESFEPFIVADLKAIGECPIEYRAVPLEGRGSLNLLAFFTNWTDFGKARSWLARETGFPPSAPQAPYMVLSDPVQQYLIRSGRTFFKGMAFSDVRRMQVDIECVTTEGYEFCNSSRKGDRIVAIAVGVGDQDVRVLDGSELDEKALLRAFVSVVQEYDPDVIEGHNIFNFDLPYIAARARMHKVKLALGRDGGTPSKRPSRFSAGERTISYDRYDIHGRSVVDTLFMVHAYDITHRSLGGYGLKDVAIHFGLASKDRTYIEGSRISETFAKDPKRVMKYVVDDINETRGVGELLSQSYFVQAQLLPYSYQNVCVRGTATKVDALMVREYLRQEHALPKPDSQRAFAGGYTDMFEEGVIQNVHHCDVRSLYPSLMLARNIAPSEDDLGVFIRLLDALRTFRFEAKQRMSESTREADRRHFDALQTTFKVLINSFYGYLGFSQARFGDFGAAEEVTRGGRELLKEMIDWLREHDATPIEIDTDGIYFVPPAFKTSADQDAFRKAFSDSLPEGIEIEFDGEYSSMFSYKMKNYALLTREGEVTIKGAALKSRGLEPFQRDFLGKVIRLKLEGREQDIPALKDEFVQAIETRAWPISRLAKTETLQDSPATYEAKRKTGKRAKSAAYELALKADREYRAGDQLSFYVTGEKKSVAVNAYARLVAEWDPEQRDENVPYYLAKLEALFKKFCEEAPRQGELAL